MTQREVYGLKMAWWRHQMETFSALLAICAGNSTVTGEFPTQRPVTRSFDVSLTYACINGRVNNGESGDFRRHRTNYDVTVMRKGRLRLWKKDHRVHILWDTLKCVYHIIHRNKCFNKRSFLWSWLSVIKCNTAPNLMWHWDLDKSVKHVQSNSKAR